jgi:hypothetical protein
MDAPNQLFLDAIRGVVGTAVAPLATKIDTLTERVDTLTERVDRIDDEQKDHRKLLQILLMRSSDLAVKVDGATTELFAIQDRLSGVEERVDKGFRALKDDLTLAFKDIQRFRTEYTRQHTLADQDLKAALRRIEALEEGRPPT